MVLLAFFAWGLWRPVFYLGKADRGILHKLFLWTFIPAAMARFYFIQFLTMSGGEINRKYHAMLTSAPFPVVVNKRSSTNVSTTGELEQLYRLTGEGQVGGRGGLQQKKTTGAALSASTPFKFIITLIYLLNIFFLTFTRMKTRLLLLLVLLCTCSPSFAQMIGDVKHLAEIKKRPLIVVLPEVSGPDGNAEEERIAQVFRVNMEKYWSFNQDITYMKASDIRALKKKKKKELSTHAILEFGTWDVTRTKDYAVVNKWQSSILAIGLLEWTVKHYYNYYTYAHNFFSIRPSEGELVSAMLQIQNFMNKSIRDNKDMSYPNESKRHAGALKQVTLLLDRKQLQDKVTDQIIRESYGLPYKLVDTEEIDEAILSRKKGFAYVSLQPAGMKTPNLLLQLVVDAESGEVLAHSFPPPLRIGGLIYGDKIDKASLKDFARYTK